MKKVFLVPLLFLMQPVLLRAAPQKPGEIEASVVKQIETGTAKQFKLGKVKGQCDKAPEKPKDGDTFACSATTKDKRKLHLTAKISVVAQGKYKVALMTTNLLDGGALNELIKKVLPDIEDQTSEKVPFKNVDCGPNYIFANAADMTIPCTVKIPSTNEKKKAEIHYTKTLITVKVDTGAKENPASQPTPATPPPNAPEKK